jgi:hypothetical protein
MLAKSTDHTGSTAPGAIIETMRARALVTENVRVDELIVQGHSFIWARPMHGVCGGFDVFAFGGDRVGRVQRSGTDDEEHSRRLRIHGYYYGVQGEPYLYVSKTFVADHGMLKQSEKFPGTTVTLESVATYFLHSYDYGGRLGQSGRLVRDFSRTPHDEKWAIAGIAARCMSELHTAHFEVLGELLSQLTYEHGANRTAVDEHRENTLASMCRMYRRECDRRLQLKFGGVSSLDIPAQPTKEVAPVVKVGRWARIRARIGW